MLPRIKLAWSLLAPDGVMCVSIDDNEEPSLRKVLDEVFGDENHLANVVWQKRYVSNVTAKWLSDMHDYVVIYAKHKDSVAVASWERNEEQIAAYKNPDNDPRGVWRAQDLSAGKPYSAGMFPIHGPTGEVFSPPPNRYWRCNQSQFTEWVNDNRIWWGVNRDARPMLKSFLSESERGITPNTWWDYGFAGHNKEATLELKELFGGDAPFDTPKPVKLIQRIIQLFCKPRQIVLDFFAGSATTGHATMDAGCGEGFSGLRFVLVQLPEATDRKGYSTLADVARDRLFRASRALRSNMLNSSADLGFRVFKLDSGNIEPWDPAAKDVPSAIAKAVDNIKADRTDDDLVYDVLLKTGLDLCVPIESKKIAGKEVKSIGGGVLFTCFATKIKAADAEPLALGIVKWRDELAPANPKECRVVFRDSAFESDVAKSNLAAILKQHGFDEKLIASL